MKNEKMNLPVYLKLFSLLLIIQFLSCEKEIPGDNTNDHNYSVTQEHLFTLQDDIIFPNENTVELKSNNDEKIKNIQAIRNTNGENLMYVLNFKNGGFIVYSADKRVRPIRAFSLEGEFIVDTSKFNSGLTDWYIFNTTLINDIKKSSNEQTEEMKIAWKKQSIQNLLNSSARLSQKAPDPELDPVDPLDDSYCTDYYKSVGPLIGTSWYQRDAFNDALSSSYNCRTDDPEPPVGCVALQ